MNLASWIILAGVLIWIGAAVKVAFFGGFKKKKDGSHHTDYSADAGEKRRHPSDEELRLPSACIGCSKGSCVGCAGVLRDVPTPIIHEPD